MSGFSSMTRSWLSYLTTTLFLLLAGAVAGMAVAVLGLALASAFQSLHQSGGEGLMSFLSGLFFLFINVLAVSTVAAPYGLWAGLLTALAISLCYGAILLFFPQLLFQSGWLALIFAIAGAIVAPLSLHGVLADYTTAAAITGALLGIITALALGRRHQNAPSPQPAQNA
jgi:hypothetical protein